MKPLALLLVAAPFPVLAADIPMLDEITVLGQRPVFAPFSSARVTPAPMLTDVAAKLAELPGAAVVKNGPLTGIAQVRGLTGDRVNILVDGMDITPACPNHMDPPLHYTAASDMENMTLIAGVSPVSAGGDALGASILARSVRPAFASGSEWSPSGRIDAGFSGANDGWNLGLNARAANQDNALSYAGNFAQGDDLRFADGDVKGTGYDSRRHKLSYARAGERSRFDASISQHRVQDAGNPSLPMDMIKDDADAVNLAWEGMLGDTSVSTRVYWHDIEHLMDNYSIRPNAGTRMYAPAGSTDVGLSLGGKRSLAGGRVNFGVEWLKNDFDAFQWNATTNAFNLDILKDSERSRLGLYGEWQGVIAGAWSANLGLRSDTVRMDTGNVAWGAVPGGVSAAGTAFNARDRQRTDHNWDWTALFQYAAASDLGYEVGLARKTRSPSLLERYEWTPLSASAGQADGNNYLGNLDLKPEVAHTLSMAINRATGAHGFKLGAFYQKVDDYIGVKEVRTATPYNASGHTRALQFDNQSARLHGLDGSWQYQSGAWQFSSAVSYVRGRNTDRDTDLYRIAPLRLTLEAGYQSGAWQNRLISRMAQSQKDVATYDFSAVGGTGPANNETTTPGYAVIDWHAQWQAAKGVKVNFGIDNLLDKLYYDHLGGVNRITGSDVAVNARLPSAGRFAFAQLEWTL